MKILNLRFKNINSLYGEWSIDFTDQAYAANGIFAIVGPTGAGKSTILDAVALALYGTTPRLGKITQSGNELMSRQTAESFAEVTFAAQDGTYRCHWSQHRARKKADGNLADARHEIADALTGNLLESKKRDVAVVIEAKTGMNFDRFTRSVLLAQGGFAAFLKAAPDERSPVLEQITGTEVYSELSIKTYERYREERETLEHLQAGVEGLTLLSDEALLQTQRAIREKQQIAEQLVVQQGKLRRLVQWVHARDLLQAETGELETALGVETQQAVHCEPERVRLKAALRAAEVEPLYGVLTARREQADAAEKKLQQERLQRPLLLQQIAEAESLVTAAVQAREETKKREQAEQNLIVKVRGIDTACGEKARALAAFRQELARDSTLLEEQLTLLTKKRVSKAQITFERERLQQYALDHAQDEALVTAFTGLTEKVASYTAVQSRVAENKKLLKAARKAYKEQRAGVLQQEQDANNLKQTTQKADALVVAAQQRLQEYLGGRLLREYRTAYEHKLLQKSLQQRIASLEEDRKKLLDGTPCPLCGSAHHPFAEGNVPAMNDAEREVTELAGVIKEAEMLEQELDSCRTVAQQWEKKTVAFERVFHEAELNLGQLLREGERLAEELQRAEEQCLAVQQGLCKTMQPFFDALPLVADFSNLLSALERRRDTWLTTRNQLETTSTALYAIDAEERHLAGITETRIAANHERKKEEELLSEALSALHKERELLYEKRDPDAEAVRFSAAVALATQREREAQLAREGLQRELAAGEQRITMLEAETAAVSSRIEQQQHDFTVACAAAGFTGEALFCAARMSNVERSALEQAAREHDDKRAALTARITDRKEQLEVLLQQQPAAFGTAAEQEEELRGLETELTKLSETTGALKQQLATDAANRSRRVEQILALEKHRTVYARWGKINELIGSADGKKFRNFAQGITFELVVAHANRQLRRMTDRYLLVSDRVLPLELAVMDNYQAGEVRSAKNLSGGESFIVSLALALGLSQMTNSKVRVDSLFLDEGFGALDEEALDMALETLATLPREGKLIGVISHVGALKERIATQIVVSSTTGGRSSLSGPGVRSL